MKTNEEIREEFNKTFIKIDGKKDLKAYLISDKNCDAECQIIVWAMSSGMAKAQGLRNDAFDGFEFTELRAERQKCFDKYADTQRIPIKELIGRGWWFYCAKCGCVQISEYNIEDGEAFIDSEDGDYSTFVKGAVVCDKCHKALLEAENE